MFEINSPTNTYPFNDFSLIDVTVNGLNTYYLTLIYHFECNISERIDLRFDANCRYFRPWKGSYTNYSPTHKEVCHTRSLKCVNSAFLSKDLFRY